MQIALRRLIIIKKGDEKQLWRYFSRRRTNVVLADSRLQHVQPHLLYLFGPCSGTLTRSTIWPDTDRGVYICIECRKTILKKKKLHDHKNKTKRITFTKAEKQGDELVMMGYERSRRKLALISHRSTSLKPYVYYAGGRKKQANTKVSQTWSSGTWRQHNLVLCPASETADNQQRKRWN